MDFVLDCFGVGDGAACHDRNHSAYLYRFSRCNLLLDCGEAMSGSYRASGLSCDLIDEIFISHLHFDHVGGVFMFLQGLWLEKRKKPLTVHLPSEGLDPVQRMLRAGFLFEELFPFQLRFRALEPNVPLEVAGGRITPFLTSHLESLRRSFQPKYRQDFMACSFLMEIDGLRIAHSADLGAVEDLAPLVAQPLDLLVCELSHFEPEAVFTYLQGRPLREVAFTHLGRAHWERREETARLAGRYLEGVRVVFPKDGEELRLEVRS